MSWLGADPGGKDSFGVAILLDNGTYETACVDCASEAFNWFIARSITPSGIGIDCPLWWSSEKSGDRQVDVLLRKKYHSKSVMCINSLQGAALVQGVMLAIMLREKYPNIQMTETHPKVLLKALGIKDNEINKRFDLAQELPKNDHERDAVVSAVAMRNGVSKEWKHDLIEIKRANGEMDPGKSFFGPVRYYWFEDIVQ